MHVVEIHVVFSVQYKCSAVARCCIDNESKLPVISDIGRSQTFDREEAKKAIENILKF